MDKTNLPVTADRRQRRTGQHASTSAGARPVLSAWDNAADAALRADGTAVALRLARFNLEGALAADADMLAMQAEVLRSRIEQLAARIGR